MNRDNVKILAASFFFSLFWVAIFNWFQNRPIRFNSPDPAVIEAEVPGEKPPRFGPELEPCRDEMDRLCADASTARQAYDCLLERESGLPAICRAVLDEFKAPLVAACGDEIKRFCADLTFGGSRIRNCLLARQPDLSKKCSGLLIPEAPKK